jgi:hypothetical protein
LSVCIAARVNLVHPWFTLGMCMSTMGAFYAAHWQTYVTGVLRFGK